MGLRKGQTNNPNGRPQGSKGLRKVQWESLSETILNAHTKEFDDYLHELWKGDQAQRFMAAQLYLKTLQYFKPKCPISPIPIEW